MNDPTLIADLVRAGVDPDLVGRVANAIASASGGNRVDSRVDETAEKRRAWDREYRRNIRNVHPTSTRHPPDPPDNEKSALSILEEDNNKKEKKERKRGQKIPPDWQPNVGHIAAGKQLGFSEQQISEQAEDMRLWAQSNDHRAVARKSDWNLTFLGWLRRNRPKTEPEPPPPPTGPPQPPRPGLPSDAELRAKYGAMLNGRKDSSGASASLRPEGRGVHEKDDAGPSEGGRDFSRHPARVGRMAVLGAVLPRISQLRTCSDEAGPNGFAGGDDDPGSMA